MREPQARRDQREILVPARPRDPRASAPRRRRKVSASSGWTATLAAAGGAAGRLCLARPGTVLGSLAALGAVSMVSLNALGYQVGRHPAPIFPKVATRPALPRVVGEAAMSRPEAAKSDAAKADAVKAEPAKPRREEAKAEAALPARAATRDSIGEIIKAGESRNGEGRSTETTASVGPKGGLTLAQAQRALVKLGYGPLKVDGVMGAGTRAAIEKFERDRKLPVKGEPAGRTLRELAARAGLTQG